MLTDGMSLFDVLTKASLTTEKHLMIGLQAFKDLYKNMEIDHTAYVKSEYNIGDPLTKIRNNSILLRLLSTSMLDHLVRTMDN